MLSFDKSTRHFVNTQNNCTCKPKNFIGNEQQKAVDKTLFVRNNSL